MNQPNLADQGSALHKGISLATSRLTQYKASNFERLLAYDAALLRAFFDVLNELEVRLRSVDFRFAQKNITSRANRKISSQCK